MDVPCTVVKSTPFCLREFHSQIGVDNDRLIRKLLLRLGGGTTTEEYYSRREDLYRSKLRRCCLSSCDEGRFTGYGRQKEVLNDKKF